MIPYSRQFIDKTDIKIINKALTSDLITQGNLNNRFEKEVSGKLKSKYAITTNSATSALHISCIALGLSKGDIFWTVPNTFVASANAGIMCGAKVDFVDIDSETLNISVLELEKKLIKSKKNNTLPKLIIPVHFGGQPTFQEKIWKLSKKYNFKIIEDASHSVGSLRKKNYVGSCKWSDITVFSFHAVKIITTAEGGMALTNSEILASKMNMLKTHGVTRDKKKFFNKNSNDWVYEQHFLGFNYRLNEIQAGLGISQFSKIDKFVKKRNEIALFYKENLSSLPIKFQKISTGNYSSYHLFIILLDRRKTNKTQKELYDFFKKNNVQTNIHYMPVHRQPFYKKMGFRNGDFPISEEYSKKCLSIPIFYNLKKIEQKKIINLFYKFFL